MNDLETAADVVEVIRTRTFDACLDVSFAEHAGTMSVTVRRTYRPVAGDSKNMIDGANAGWTEQLDRLEPYVRARV